MSSAGGHTCYMRPRPPGISGGLCEGFYGPTHFPVSLSGSIVPDVRANRYESVLTKDAGVPPNANRGQPPLRSKS
jgi:hypothetical protein